MRFRRWVSRIALFLASVPCPGTQAQAPARETVGLLPPVKTELVRIDVVVTDKKGQPVSGLGRDDFAILEDGRPQPVVQFEAFARGLPTVEPETPATPAGASPLDAPAEPEVRRGRYVVLAVDDLHIEPANLFRAKSALQRLVEERIGSEDQVALVTTSGTLGLLQQFTADSMVLGRAISRLSSRQRVGEWEGAPHISEYQAELIERGDPDALALAVQELLQEGLSQNAEVARMESLSRARAIAEESTHHSRVTLETLDGVMRSLAGLPGRKVIVLVSDGFVLGVGWASNRTFDIRRITDAGTRAGVVIYALDTRGLVGTPLFGDASTRGVPVFNAPGARESIQRAGENATRDGMNALAADTGGFLIQSSNDLAAGLRRIVQDGETYYLLAYEPTNPRHDGGFRKIEVSLPGRRDVKLRTRKGYFAPDDRKPAPAPRAPEAPDAAREAGERRESEIRRALASLVPLAAIPVRLSADFVSAGRAGGQVVVSGHVDVSAVPFERVEGRRVATVEAVAVVYDEAGNVAANLQSERAAMQLTDTTYAQALQAGLDYRKVAALKPGLYQVRLAVREEAAGKLGSASQWIEVPDLDKGKLTLSSLFFLRGEEALHEVQALRRYRRSESLYVQLYAYNPKRDAAGATRLFLQTQVWQRGALRTASPPEPLTPREQDGRPVPQTATLKLDPLEPGDYELRVTVTDRLANATAFRRTGFSVD
jgi:VWFA-related protein